MKYILGLIAGLLLLGGGVLFYFQSLTPRTLSTPTQQTVDARLNPSASPVLSANIQPTQTRGMSFASLQQLVIPRLGVTATIESVGMDKNGNMDVPKNAMNVAWYNLGVLPGQKGNAVMAGHLDTVLGAPAVFAKIEILQPGDELQVARRRDDPLIYKVSEIRRYSLSDFPLQEVFGASDSYRLNLITCSGTFNSQSNIYSHRTVVYSELVQ